MRGKFITFEGPEGCGKSTQSKLLYQYLKRKGLKAIYLREPGGTQVSEKIRKILLDPKNHIASRAEMLLYMAARAQIVDGVIRPALNRGINVICDRFMDSTLAYQGYGLGIDITFIRSVGFFATGGLNPDLTILLDVPVKQGLKHRHLKRDRIEKRSLSYHNRVRRGYLKLARIEPRRLKVVEFVQGIEKVQQRIREIVTKYVI
ncbi:MAG: dTMP kinase [Candidatus Omnitrophica bacterium]|nr:dTMP kinase [Candidatus Omnitrophota bacterium]